MMALICSFKNGVWSTYANRITAFRICLLPFFVYFHIGGKYEIALAIWVVMGALDWLDGYMARKFKQVSSFGKKFDPVADKIIMIVSLPTVIIGLFSLIPYDQWAFFLRLIIGLFANEAALLTAGVWAYKKGFITQANLFGKLKMWSECLIFIFGYWFIYVENNILPAEIMTKTLADLFILSIVLAMLSFVGHIFSFTEPKKQSAQTQRA